MRIHQPVMQNRHLLWVGILNQNISGSLLVSVFWLHLVFWQVWTTSRPRIPRCSWCPNSGLSCSTGRQCWIQKERRQPYWHMGHSWESRFAWQSACCQKSCRVWRKSCLNSQCRRAGCICPVGREYSFCLHRSLWFLFWRAHPAGFRLRNPS